MKQLTKITKIPKELEGHITAKTVQVVLNNWYGEDFSVKEVKGER